MTAIFKTHTFLVEGEYSQQPFPETSLIITTLKLHCSLYFTDKAK